MILNNDYWWFESALSAAQCDTIIALGEAEIANSLSSGRSISAGTAGGHDKETLLSQGVLESDLVSLGSKTIDNAKKAAQDCKKTFVRDTDIAWLNNEIIYSWLHPLMHEANVKAGWNFNVDFSESLQFTRYGLNQFYGWHPDAKATPYPPFWDVSNPPEGEPFDVEFDQDTKLFVPKGGFNTPENREKWSHNPSSAGKIRKLSMTVNLSLPNSYKGGNLKFDFGPHATNNRYHTCKEIRPRGSVIVFPSDRFHQVTPVTEGVRYSLVLWSLGEPWK
jgi:hypothetical protein